MTPDLVYLTAGFGLLLGAFLPRFIRDRAISAPLVVVAVGVAVGWFIPGDEPIAPVLHETIATHVSELCVIVALMGVGLAIDRPFSWRTWRVTWRLLLVAMPLCIAATALLGWWVIGLTPAAALLLGAALAPTDPVLASDIQVEGPSVLDPEDPTSPTDPDEADDHTRATEQAAYEEEDEVRFALTSEAGLNDSLAFPFVYLAIGLATKGPLSGWVGTWVAWDLVGKLLIGVAVGWLAGWVTGKVVFRSRLDHLRLADAREPLLALALVLATYGLTELVGGYGFLAVFVAAVTLRQSERTHAYHGHLHDAIEHLESILTLLILMLLGASLSSGQLAHLTWGGVVVALALVLVVRPVTGWVSLARVPELSRGERLATAAFGVRGIGTVYYLAYATSQAEWAEKDLVWSTATVAILLSVVVHGVAATPVMRRLEESREARSGSDAPARRTVDGRVGRPSPQDGTTSPAATPAGPPRGA
ncbi:cation:proton antiporter [Arsenicicoccus piscis]|uniref:Cation transporter n=1 Tax=Arsenicicoccus piscis TaxID=673954 RepID=A0ABQ6HN15_9MICO|nr:cation:proton antiporter [Arsenicicoccus piscis]GMA19840.1 cation transporter [Arsenicicoccus piscis]